MTSVVYGDCAAISSSVVYEKSCALTDNPMFYCPGCSHGIVHKLVAESLAELEIYQKSIVVTAVGCSVLSYNYFNFDGLQAAHGRATAVATGVKRTNPDKIVFTYQGDGDLAAIGTGETVHAAHRGENITVIFMNNAIYGMTGGQMAPTTLVDQKTSTSPFGRQENGQGKPLLVSEMLSQIPSATYIERVSVYNVPHILRAKKAIRKAFENQIQGKGFSMVEVLGACPIGWGMKPTDAMNFIKEHMIPYYPLGVFKDKGGDNQ